MWPLLSDFFSSVHIVADWCLINEFQLHFSLGLMFVINGGCYAVTAPCFGVICDKWAHPTIVNYFGLISVIASFTLLGPAPYFPIPTYISVCIVALILHGCALGATLVSGFSIAHKEAVRNGFPDNFDTHGVISGLWTSVFALGAFIGPSVAGVMYQHLGMRWASQFIVVFGLLVLAITIGSSWLKARWARNRRSEYEPIVTDDQLGQDYGSRRSGRSPSIGYSSGSGQSSSNPSPPLVGVDPEQARSLPHAESSSSLAMRGTGQRRRSRSALPMSPKSPFQSGSMGLFGGVSGYAVPIHHGAAAAAGIPDMPHEMPHDVILEHEPTGAPPRRNARSGRQKKSSTNLAGRQSSSSQQP